MKQIFLLLIISLTIIIFANNEVTITENQIQGRLNIVNGSSAECVMHKFYTDTGWIRIEGEVGRNGIDGLYLKKKNGVISEVLIAESKWNKSRLGKSGKNKLIKQMSKNWVLRTLRRLQKYKPLPEYTTIKKLVQQDQYRAILFRMFPRSNNKVQIQIYKIKNKGFNDYDLKIEQKLDSIVMKHPKNSFQAMILNSYNSCRTKALNKYFPMLSNRDIIYLLNDNYLQKKDLMTSLYKK